MKACLPRAVSLDCQPFMETRSSASRRLPTHRNAWSRAFTLLNTSRSTIWKRLSRRACACSSQAGY